MKKLTGMVCRAIATLARGGLA